MTRRKTHARKSMTRTYGTILSIQLKKLISIPAFWSAPRAMAFGGVPIGVPMPPRLAAIGIARARPALPFSSFGSAPSTGARKVRNIAAVAVLLMNMENTPMMRRNARRTHFGFLKGLRRVLAIATSRPTLEAAMARTNPPRKSMITGSANAAMIDL